MHRTMTTCPECGMDAVHEIRLELRRESDREDRIARKYSREPYRVTTCQVCGRETAIRMNSETAVTG